MAEELYYIDNPGNIRNLWDANPYRFVAEQGTGEVGLNVYEQVLPFEDGAVERGNGVGPREFQIGINVYGDTLALVEQRIGQLHRWLSRRYGPGSIRRVRSDGVKRQIDCRKIAGPVGSSTETLDAPVSTIPLTFRASWPYWYDPDADDYVTCSFAACSGVSVTNGGDVATYPVITISDMVNLEDPCLTLGAEKIEFDYTFASGTLVLDLSIGVKTCKIGSTSYLGYITADSVLFDLEPGLNYVAFSCASGSGDVRIEWTEWFELLW